MFTLEDVVVDMDQYADLDEDTLYGMIGTREARKSLLDKFQPNPILWRKHFGNTVSMAQNGKRGGLAKIFHGLRILVQRQTMAAIQRGFYLTTDGTKVVLDNKDLVESAKGTIYCKSKDMAMLESSSDINIDDEKSMDPVQTLDHLDVDVLNTDCLDAAYSLLSNGVNPCVLNMANAHAIGGGWQSGAGAQEENLCRRSTLITALINYTESPKQKLDVDRSWKYPIGEFDTIYSPKVTVFRSNEHLGYDFLADPYQIGVVTAAMVQRPSYTKDFDYSEKDKQVVTDKLKSVLRTAVTNGHDSIVLSAWGCGAFKNPPLGQARLWNEVLNSKEFRGTLKKVVFAIFDDHNAGKDHNPFGNFLPFVNVFMIKTKRISEFVDSIKNDEQKGNDDAVDPYQGLKEIFDGVSMSEKTRDLDYEVVSKKLKSEPAIRVLYCAGWKRSSDGSRLQLESKRIQIASDVYQRLRKLVKSKEETQND